MLEESRYSIIDAITKASGYDIALMTTFNFDIDFFERMILSPLFERNVRKISVFVDSDELAKSLSSVEYCNIGVKYMVTPVKMQSAFHPKVFLLLGQDKARLIIGSANITTSGFSFNNEIFNFFEYSPKEPQYRDLIVSAIRFFVDINKISFGLDHDIIEEVKRLPYYRNAIDNGEVKLFSSIHDSVLNQIRDNINGKVTSIKIAVPYFDYYLVALQKLSSVFSNASISLYIQNKKSSFPVSYYNEHKVICDIVPYNGFKDGDLYSKNNFYHGKVFSFETEKSSYIVYGSANCTGAALIKAYNEGGNVECVLLESGEKGEFDYFFENFEENKADKLETNLLVYNLDERTRFSYRYGELKEDGNLCLYLSNNGNDSFIIKIKDVEIPYMISEGVVVAEIPALLVNPSNGMVLITIEFGDETEIIKGWYFNKTLLNINRRKQTERFTFDSFDPSANSEKYIIERTNLLLAWEMCLPELIENKKMIAQVNQIKLEQEDNDSNDEDFILDIQIPEDYVKEYRIYETTSKIREGYYHRLFARKLNVFKLSDSSKIRKPGYKKETEKDDKIRVSIPEEKRFARFVSSRIKGMMDTDFIKDALPKHYYGVVLVVLEIFYKYNDSDLFELRYMFETRARLYINTLSMDFSEDEKLRDELFRDSIYVLIDNYSISKSIKDITEREEYDTLNKALLLAIEQKYPMRSTYKNVLSKLAKEEDPYMPTYDDYFFDYIENLYGYKNKELLNDFIKSKYDNAEIIYLNRNICINATSDTMNKHFDPDMLVVKEVGDYSRKIEPIETLSICIKSETGKIVQIEHIISYRFKTWKSITTYSNGNKLESKPDYINV